MSTDRIEKSLGVKLQGGFAAGVRVQGQITVPGYDVRRGLKTRNQALSRLMDANPAPS